MAGSNTKQPRRSRITAACTVCRAKRQKCSGEKPVCDQCRTHNEDCQWSDQKKRGPVKDYLRSLQDRLQETESLLLDMLVTTDNVQLSNAIAATTPRAMPSHQTWINDLSGPQHWSQFPLASIEDIRAWQKFRSDQSSGGTFDDQANGPDEEAVVPAVITPAQQRLRPQPGLNDTDTRQQVEIQACRVRPSGIEHARGAEHHLQTGFEVGVAENGDDEMTRQAADQLHTLPHNPRPRLSDAPVSSELGVADEAAHPRSDMVPTRFENFPSDFPRHLFW